MKFTTITTALLFSLASTVSALPIHVRDVFVPTITSPVGGEQYTVGANITVTWDTSDAPQNITNSEGIIKLRKGDRTLAGSLAEGFSILLGEYNVTVPNNVTAGDDYRIVLFGDSGNWSPAFSVIDA